MRCVAAFVVVVVLSLAAAAAGMPPVEPWDKFEKCPSSVSGHSVDELGDKESTFYCNRACGQDFVKEQMRQACTLLCTTPCEGDEHDHHCLYSCEAAVRGHLHVYPKPGLPVFAKILLGVCAVVAFFGLAFCAVVAVGEIRKRLTTRHYTSLASNE